MLPFMASKPVLARGRGLGRLIFLLFQSWVAWAILGAIAVIWIVVAVIKRGSE